MYSSLDGSETVNLFFMKLIQFLYILNRAGEVKAQFMFGHLEMVAFGATTVTAMVTHQICIPYLLVR